MLSNNALKLLKWFSEQKDLVSRSEAKENCKHYNDRSIEALVSGKYLKESLSLEGSQWTKYQITDAGEAYMQGVGRSKMMNVREWLSFGLSVAAIAISIIALLMQAEIL